jgi:predicted O-methyltransferase YrrM
MYSPSRIALKYFKYLMFSSNGRGHGIHSPFVFEFIQKVLNDKKQYPEYAAIEKARKKLLHDKTPVPVEDFGAGTSVSGSGNTKTVASVATNSAKPPRYAQLLFRMSRYYAPQNTLELGTSLGISTAYLAAGNSNMVITGEGNKALASIAKTQLDALGYPHVKIITGHFDHTLPQMLAAMPRVDIAFMDGNHRKIPTLKYFNLLLPKLSPSAAIVIDDIHWSEEMESAWKTIKEDPRVMLTADLFFLGIVFFRPEFKVKQHFVIRF